MNFQLGQNHSVILISVRPDAPYADRLEDDGSTLIYEGHDLPRSAQKQGPKIVDLDNIQLLCGRHNLEKHNRIE